MGLGHSASEPPPARDDKVPQRNDRTRKPVGRPTRVLVVDDAQDIAFVTAEILNAWGYDARYVLDGMAGLAIAESFEPDVAVLDLGMPIMDGVELARRLRAHPRLSRTRLIAVTGRASDSEEALSARVGFAAHLMKPINFDMLEKLLARWYKS